MDFYLAIIGIAGGIMCAVADLFLDLKGPENEKIGKMKINLCPTIYRIIKKESGLELADRVTCATFKHISVPFFICYTMLVIIPSGMVIFHSELLHLLLFDHR